jgi:hypothetical protein
MFKNYFKSAWRNLSKEKDFSSINIVGLAARKWLEGFVYRASL